MPFWVRCKQQCASQELGTSEVLVRRDCIVVLELGHARPRSPNSSAFRLARVACLSVSH
jgi:hypothetical protein